MIMPGLAKGAVGEFAGRLGDKLAQRRTVSYVTTTPRLSNNASTSRRLRLNRKYQRSGKLITTAAKRWP
jgi:hypothetical protein